MERINELLGLFEQFEADEDSLIANASAKTVQTLNYDEIKFNHLNMTIEDTKSLRKLISDSMANYLTEIQSDLERKLKQVYTFEKIIEMEMERKGIAHNPDEYEELIGKRIMDSVYKLKRLIKKDFTNIYR